MFHKSNLSKKGVSGKMKPLFLQNAQGCQLGTLQIPILHGLVVSNPLKTIVGPSLQGWIKNTTSAAGLGVVYATNAYKVSSSRLYNKRSKTQTNLLDLNRPIFVYNV